MARVKAIYRPSDYAGDPDSQMAKDVATLFAALFPQKPDASFDKSHAGMAIAARNPKLAQHLAKISGFMALELGWCQRRDLRELAIQTVNTRFNSTYSFKARHPIALGAGIDAAKQAAIRDWRTSDLFDDEQRLVIEYAEAVTKAEVPDELFARAVQKFGETGTIEFTAMVGFWSFWAMFLNATGPELEPEPTG